MGWEDLPPEQPNWITEIEKCPNCDRLVTERDRYWQEKQEALKAFDELQGNYNRLAAEVERLNREACIFEARSYSYSIEIAELKKEVRRVVERAEKSESQLTQAQAEVEKLRDALIKIYESKYMNFEDMQETARQALGGGE